MTVPQSLLVVALAVAWLIVLVPSSSRRRGHVKETIEGSGFRVLTRTPARRTLRRTTPSPAAAQDTPRNVRSEDQMVSQQVDDGSFRGEDDTVVLDTVGSVDPTDTVHRFESVDTAQAVERDAPDLFEDGDSDVRSTVPYTDQYTPADHRADVEDAIEGADVDEDARSEAAREEAAAYDEHDEAELRRQYQAWRASTTADTAESDTGTAPEAATEPAAVRPIPRRPGRGTYDPEAAERARAYKYARRRRAVLVLALLTVGFAIAAVLVSSALWTGAVASVALLALFMTYLRRQVKIETDIRNRRLAKLERARQIRPEHADAAQGWSGPPAGRTSSGAPGPVRRSNRVVLELDDDDPGFDDLEQYEPMEYRRAVGQ